MADYPYIHPNLQPLAVDISLLDPLPGNPRVGDVEAIAASLESFGQVKPIVVRPTEDGRYVILAGNHTTEAARALGWTHIAAVVGSDMDDSQAAAFALVDNQVADLAYTDQELLNEAIVDVVEVYGELFEVLGWDEFELALMSDSAARSSASAEDNSPMRDFSSTGEPARVVPSLAPEPPRSEPNIAPVSIADESMDSGVRLVAPEGINETATVISGVGGTTAQGSITKKAQVQYTLVFDDAAQMGRWWDFVKFLRNSPVYEGDTIAERLVNFIEAHGEF